MGKHQKKKMSLAEFSSTQSSSLVAPPPPPAPPPLPPPPAAGSIYVCVGSACQQDGAEQTLVELEELAAATGGRCTVHADWCFGLCGSGPNATISAGSGDCDEEEVHTNIASMEQSVALVFKASGQQPAIDPVRRAAMEAARRAAKLEQQLMHAQLLCDLSEFQPGSTEKALALVDRVIEHSGDAHPLLLALRLRSRILSPPSGMDAASERAEKWGKAASWRLDAIKPQSRRSAVFQLSSQDGARGSVDCCPGGRVASTWHVAIHVLAEQAGGSGAAERQIGSAGGALLTREYTPISTAEQWERGEVALLVKIYPDGKVTRWMHEQLTVGARVWLSPPCATLRLPELTPAATPRGGASARVLCALSDSVGTSSVTAAPPAPPTFGSVLLVAGGTGIAPLWQVARSCAGDDALAELPLSIVYSCRADDVLLLAEVRELVRCRAATRVVITLTSPSDGEPAYPDGAPAAVGSLEDMHAQHDLDLDGTITLATGRVTPALLAASLPPRAEDVQRLRAIVSGPSSFLADVASMLHALCVRADAIVTLKA